MTDIALFVAEDFERRTKSCEKGVQRGGFEFSSAMAAIGSPAIFLVEAKLAEKPAFMQEIPDIHEEPERSFYLNLINGFFSA